MIAHIGKRLLTIGGCVRHARSNRTETVSVWSMAMFHRFVLDSPHRDKDMTMAFVLQKATQLRKDTSKAMYAAKSKEIVK